ncbi:Smr protein/MutS2 C-terminal, partial [Thalictrum thalictroides]
MLGRTQISKISQNARSFLLSSSRCSVADGNSCSTAEDETHVPRTLERNNEVLSVQTGNLNSCDAKTTVTRPKTRSVVQSSSVSAHVSSVSSSLPSSGCENSVFGDVHASQTNLLDSSVYVVDQFLKAGIVA